MRCQPLCAMHLYHIYICKSAKSTKNGIEMKTMERSAHKRAERLHAKRAEEKECGKNNVITKMQSVFERSQHTKAFWGI